MAGVPLIALEVVLGFCVPLGWAVWELLSLRRERQRDAEKARVGSLSELNQAAPGKPPPRGPPVA